MLRKPHIISLIGIALAASVSSMAMRPRVSADFLLAQEKVPASGQAEKAAPGKIDVQKSGVVPEGAAGEKQKAPLKKGGGERESGGRDAAKKTPSPSGEKKISAEGKAQAPGNKLDVRDMVPDGSADLHKNASKKLQDIRSGGGAEEKKEERALVPPAGDDVRRSEKGQSTDYRAVGPGAPGADGRLAGWREAMTFRELAQWARAYGLKPRRNAPPLETGAARFVSKFGSTVKFEGLDPFRRYRIFIDFVTYDALEKNDINARLEVSADREKIGEFAFGAPGRAENPVCLEIPWHLTMDGSVDICFREFSAEGGFWGVWDMVVTDALALPGRLDGTKMRTDEIVDRGSIVEPWHGGRKRGEFKARPETITARGSGAAPEEEVASGPGSKEAPMMEISPKAGKKTPAKLSPALKKKERKTHPAPTVSGKVREKKAREMLREDKKLDRPFPPKL